MINFASCLNVVQHYCYHSVDSLQILDQIIDNIQMGRDCLTLPRKRTLEEIVRNPALVRKSNIMSSSICLNLFSL